MTHQQEGTSLQPLGDLEVLVSWSQGGTGVIIDEVSIAGLDVPVGAFSAQQRAEWVASIERELERERDDAADDKGELESEAAYWARLG